MIGYLEGSIQAITENELILRVGDVGYEVQCPTNILQAAQLGQTKALYIHTHIHIDVRDVRKTRLLLYGFNTPEDKKLVFTPCVCPGHWGSEIFEYLRSNDGSRRWPEPLKTMIGKPSNRPRAWGRNSPGTS